jgi:hypothetical protein
LQKVGPEQPESVQKVLTGFERFFILYDKLLTNDEMDTLPVGTSILYGDNERVAIEIQKCFHKSDAGLTANIRSHLLTISALLFPNKDTLGRLEAFKGETTNEDGEPQAFKIDVTSAEGQFIGGVMEKAKNALQNTDMSNPTNAFMGIARSGILNDMMASFSSGQVNGQKLNARKMMRVMQEAMNQMMPPGEDDDDEPAPVPKGKKQ